MTDCIFCKIVAKEIPTNLHYEDDRVVAFNDINPEAETHILIIPKEHVETAMDIEERHQELIGNLFLAAKKIAKEKGVKGYKLQMNVGQEGGQVVMHIHLHLLAGKMKKEQAG